MTCLVIDSWSHQIWTLHLIACIHLDLSISQHMHCIFRSLASPSVCINSEPCYILIAIPMFRPQPLFYLFFSLSFGFALHVKVGIEPTLTKCFKSVSAVSHPHLLLHNALTFCLHHLRFSHNVIHGFIPTPTLLFPCEWLGEKTLVQSFNDSLIYECKFTQFLCVLKKTNKTDFHLKYAQYKQSLCKYTPQTLFHAWELSWSRQVWSNGHFGPKKKLMLW